MSTYPPATLNFLSSKRKWYVYVTVPPELREGQVQIRRSTGTADKREAQKRLHGIAVAIYAEFVAENEKDSLSWPKASSLATSESPLPSKASLDLG